MRFVLEALRYDSGFSPLMKRFYLRLFGLVSSLELSGLMLRLRDMRWTTDSMGRK